MNAGKTLFTQIVLRAVSRDSLRSVDLAREFARHRGQQWHFGMKMHIGVDSRTGLAHSAVITAANVHDKHPLPRLLHGAEQRVIMRDCLVKLKACSALP